MGLFCALYNAIKEFVRLFCAPCLYSTADEDSGRRLRDKVSYPSTFTCYTLPTFIINQSHPFLPKHQSLSIVVQSLSALAAKTVFYPLPGGSYPHFIPQRTERNPKRILGLLKIKSLSISISLPQKTISSSFHSQLSHISIRVRLACVLVGCFVGLVYRNCGEDLVGRINHGKGTCRTFS